MPTECFRIERGCFQTRQWRENIAHCELGSRGLWFSDLYRVQRKLQLASKQVTQTVREKVERHTRRRVSGVSLLINYRCEI